MERQQNPSLRSQSISSPGVSSGFSWIEQNRALALRLSIAVAVIILVVLAASIWASNHSAAAQAAFSKAMDVYDSPLKQAGEPAQPDITTYVDAAARARVANPLFEQVAEKYSMTRAGANARYFAGLTDQDMGNNQAAETDLGKAANSHDKGLASLAKMALASLYLNTNRRAQALSLYQDLIDHPTTTVSANAARLAMAGAEETTNPEQARVLYARIKDSAPGTVAGEIATQKLSGK